MWQRVRADFLPEKRVRDMEEAPGGVGIEKISVCMKRLTATAMQVTHGSIRTTPSTPWKIRTYV